MRRYSKRSLDNLKGIHPHLRRVIDRALQESPLDFIVIEGLRTKERQAQLLKEKKTTTMNSRHLTGHAVDLMPIGENGKGSFAWSLYDRLGPAVEAAARKEGVPLVWGGRWKSFRDGPHFGLDRNVYPAGQSFPSQTVAPLAVDYVKPEGVTQPGEGVTKPAGWGALVAGIIAVLAFLFRRKK